MLLHKFFLILFLITGSVIFSHSDTKTTFYVVLTFDDGPYPGYTEKILSTLKKFKIKSTFFVVGRWVEKYPQLVKLIIQDGHQVGLHGYNHVDYTKLTKKQIIKELVKSKKIVENIVGKNKVKYFRPPAGKYNNVVKHCCRTLGLETVLWTFYPLDYGEKEPKKIYNRIKNYRFKKYNILLLHNGVDATVEILPQVVKKLIDKGAIFVELDFCLENLKRKE